MASPPKAHELSGDGESTQDPDNGVEYSGGITGCDICAMGKSQQLAHPKIVRYHVDAPMMLVDTDLLGPISPLALEGNN